MEKFAADILSNAKSWPFEEARKIAARFKKGAPKKGYVLFETGYGPSGLPHIGTFMEVFRTTLVRRAFEQISDIPTRLFAVSDDMDGLRKIPDNVPNADMLKDHLGKALTNIPDPFGTHASYGAHMNAKLCGFLDRYGFEYEFISSTEYYKKGMYNEKLLEALKQFDKIMALMIPTLGEERQATYSPFMPISPKTGRVLQVPMKRYDVAKGTITVDDDGTEITVPVTDGHCKLQWKPDFGMRWAALDVDFEMYGKDHQPSAPLYNSICKVLGGATPEQYVYEMFLDAEGKKISKSKGNGISIEEWLRYGTEESMAYYMFLSPRKAKRLHFDVIPKAVEEYFTFLDKYHTQTPAEQIENPVWYIHNGNPPKVKLPVTFNLLLNLASACNPDDVSVLWGFISAYAPGASIESMPELAKLVQCAKAYYEDFVKPTKQFRAPSEKERAAMLDMMAKLRALPKNAESEAIQSAVFSAGKDHGFENLREWFQALYEVLFGQSQGPRMGSFIALYGIDETLKLMEVSLSRSVAA